MKKTKFTRELTNKAMATLLSLMIALSMLPFLTLQASAAPTGVIATAVGSAEPQPIVADLAGSQTLSYQNLVLSPGSDVSQLRFTWYTAETTGKIAIRVQGTDSFTEFDAVNDKSSNGKYVHKETVTGLMPSTTYEYKLIGNSSESEVLTVKTGDPSNFSFIAMGDPQIGNTNATADGDVWKNTVKAAAAKAMQTSDNPQGNPQGASFLMTMGDQVDNTKDAGDEYKALFSPPELTGIPMAPTMGNHEYGVMFMYNNTYSETGIQLYGDHYNFPNSTEVGTVDSKIKDSVRDYWYRYGDALFIVLNGNLFTFSDHTDFMEKAIAKNQDAKWRIVSFHHALYTSGTHLKSDPGSEARRPSWTKAFNDMDIDVVFSGHDHTYMRSYHIGVDKNGEITALKDQEWLDDNSVLNPTGTLYMELTGSSTKFYGMGTETTYAAVRHGTTASPPEFAIVDVKDIGNETSFTIKTYSVVNAKVSENPLDEYTIVKQLPDENATYTVTWKNEDGTVLKTDDDVLYGTIPNYDGEVPTKEATDKFTYTFKGWSPSVTAVKRDVTYTATYTRTSTTGTPYEMATSIDNNEKYVIVVQSGNDYYALKKNGTSVAASSVTVDSENLIADEKLNDAMLWAATLHDGRYYMKNDGSFLSRKGAEVLTQTTASVDTERYSEWMYDNNNNRLYITSAAGNKTTYYLTNSGSTLSMKDNANGAAKVYLYKLLGDLPDIDDPIEDIVDTTNATYNLATAVTPGKTYIVAAESNGKYFALAKNGSNLAATEVTLNGDAVSSAVAEAMLWKFETDGSGFNVKNSGQYLDRPSGGTDIDLLSAISSAVSDNNTRWTYANNKLYTISADTSKPDLFYYLQYSSGFKATEESAANGTAIYLYEQTLVPVEPAATWTVKFNSDGGSAVASKTVDKGTPVTAPAAPTKSGYSFKGWMLDNADYDFASPVNANITLTAKWEKIEAPKPVEPTYELATSIQANERYLVVAKYTEDNATKYYALTSNPSVKGEGKYLEGQLVNVANGLVTIPAAVTDVDALLWKISAAKDGKVQSVKNNGYLTYGTSALNTSASGSAWTYSENKLYAGSSSKNYLRYSSSNNYFQTTTDIAQLKDRGIDFDLYMVVDGPTTTYKVTFDSAGGSAVATLTVKEGAAAAAPAAPTKSGYAFKGWQLNGVDYNFASAVNADITLTAKWEKVTVPTYELATTIQAGEQYLVVAKYTETSNNVATTKYYALTSNPSVKDTGKYLEGQLVTVADGLATIPAAVTDVDTLLWKISAATDGKVQSVKNDGYLTYGKSALNTSASGSEWTYSENRLYAADSSSKNYLRYSSSNNYFQTSTDISSYKDRGIDFYLFKLVKPQDIEEPEEPTEPEVTTVEISGVVSLGSSNTPATVSLYDSEGTLVDECQTDSNGAYTLSAPEGSGYKLVVTKVGYLSYTITNVDISDAGTIEDINIGIMAGDFDGDGAVNAVDLTLMLSEFGGTPTKYPHTDLNGDGVVNAIDLNILLAAFGKTSVEVSK